MQTRFDTNAYRDRVQAETTISMLKRRLEHCVRRRTYWSQCRELRLKVLTHNVMILCHMEVFYRAAHTFLSVKILLPELTQFFPDYVVLRLGGKFEMGQTL
jgi:hypothetical protein